jgi:hypothetical protein
MAASIAMRKVGWILLTSTVVAGGLCVLACSGWYQRGIDNAYAQWGAGDMLVAYMRDHDDSWPRGWNDLEPYFARQHRIAGWTFQEFQEHIEIDWAADPKALARSVPGPDGRPTFHVVRARAGADVTWSQGEPNTIIYEYLRRRYGDGSTQPVAAPGRR